MTQRNEPTQFVCSNVDSNAKQRSNDYWDCSPLVQNEQPSTLLSSQSFAGAPSHKRLRSPSPSPMAEKRRLASTTFAASSTKSRDYVLSTPSQTIASETSAATSSTTDKPHDVLQEVVELRQEFERRMDLSLSFQCFLQKTRPAPPTSPTPMRPIDVDRSSRIAGRSYSEAAAAARASAAERDSMTTVTTRERPEILQAPNPAFFVETPICSLPTGTQWNDPSTSSTMSAPDFSYRLKLASIARKERRSQEKALESVEKILKRNLKISRKLQRPRRKTKESRLTSALKFSSTLDVSADALERLGLDRDSLCAPLRAGHSKKQKLSACKRPGCSEQTHALCGVCTNHVCIVRGCVEPQKQSGFCPKHLNRYHYVQTN
jgi:hypothetical protein